MNWQTDFEAIKVQKRAELASMELKELRARFEERNGFPAPRRLTRGALIEMECTLAINLAMSAEVEANAAKALAKADN